ncbi:nickel pincer cofactor biosynthesis protein LarC [Leptolyngbya sp. NK1-12]|uniref:Putative nickel insertion protein n=1 Tax=Leptolyngbya sp. NK1-12 TaxID=2547451 RepID=A0AA96WSN6_9CYAN|nr:nickel pincer cofactor biosynthesis protein LarC [Leptolyngbya sp. NK1-12]WNZ22092.1 nickel pincer cofactor biosynthesis protein LarC [Leptolyngbya sp. NK1-12]
MTKVAYLDCPTGVSGDMCLGALVHAGVPLAYLAEQLERLGLNREYGLQAELVHRNGQQATKVYVHLCSQTSSNGHTVDSPTDLQAAVSTAHAHAHAHSDPDHSHQESPTATHPHSRHLPEIEQLIRLAHLPVRVTDWSLAVFRRLAEAEAAVHGIPPEQVHFHEVGATDAIVDIVGTCLGLDWLGIEQLYCSALPIGGGTVWAAHGRLPVPAPAVLKLWEMRQVPIYSNGIEKELVTPTGAAIVTTLATGFGAPPPLLLQQVGLGAGSTNLAIPNILRLWIGEADSKAEAVAHHPHQSLSHPAANPGTASESVAEAATPEAGLDTVAVLETQIDDLNPQAIGYVMTALLAAGALDVFTQSIGMKKSRPGVLLTVICDPAQVDTCEAILFRETTTLGIRHSIQQRSVLERVIETATIPYGQVRLKIARHNGTITNVQPEYEDCAQLAQQHNLPWREVHQLALQAWYSQRSAKVPTQAD